MPSFFLSPNQQTCQIIDIGPGRPGHHQALYRLKGVIRVVVRQHVIQIPSGRCKPLQRRPVHHTACGIGGAVGSVGTQ